MVILNQQQYSKGFGFVTMEREEDAHNAMVRLQNYVLDGRTISINLAYPKKPAVVVDTDIVKAEMRLHQAEEEVMRLREELCSRLGRGFM